jgi:hypothetical protein
MDVSGEKYKFLIKIDGKEEFREGERKLEYSEVHPSCLSKKT